MTIKSMEVNKPSPIRNVHKQERDSAGIKKFLYLVILLLIGSSGVIGIAGIRQPAATRGIADSRTASVSVSGEGAAARVLVFHLGDSGSGLCEDLTVNAAGDALYSSCDHSVEKRYALNETELSQLQGWIRQFQPVHYDHSGQTQSGTIMVQLYLNGQGSQQASDIETQQLVDFAAALAAKTASQP